MELKLNAYKDPDGRWYVDDMNGYDKEDNELVAGIPDVIEAVVGDKVTKVLVTISDEVINVGVRMEIKSKDSNGVVYTFISEDPDNYFHIEGWLCKVFFYYFKKPPKMLYATVVESK